MSESPKAEEIDPASVLREVMPELAQSPFELRTQQYGKRVWAVGPRHVLRVATNDAIRALMARERDLLERLAGKTTLAVPQPVFSAEDESFDVLLRVPGEPLSYKSWPPPYLDSIRRVSVALGRFLAELHNAILETAARALGYGEQRPRLSG